MPMWLLKTEHFEKKILVFFVGNNQFAVIFSLKLSANNF